MTHAQDLLEHPPTMAEMAGALMEEESHVTSPVAHVAAETVPLSFARLEAETEE